MQDQGSNALESIVQVAKDLSLATNVLDTAEAIKLADIIDQVNDLREKYIERRIDEVMRKILGNAKQC